MCRVIHVNESIRVIDNAKITIQAGTEIIIKGDEKTKIWFDDGAHLKLLEEED